MINYVIAGLGAQCNQILGLLPGHYVKCASGLLCSGVTDKCIQDVV